MMVINSILPIHMRFSTCQTNAVCFQAFLDKRFVINVWQKLKIHLIRLLCSTRDKDTVAKSYEFMDCKSIEQFCKSKGIEIVISISKKSDVIVVL
jgi:hypothetical protein